MAKMKPSPSSAPSRKQPILRLKKPIVIGNKTTGYDFGEIKFQRLVEHMNEAVWVGDKNEHTVYANPKFCEIMGYTLKEMLGRPSYDFWTPESAERVRDVNRRDRKRGISSNYEGDLLTKSGEIIPVLISGTPLPNGGTIGIMTDLRAIKAKEAKTQENLLNRFDLAVKGSNDGLWYSEIPASAVQGKIDIIHFLTHSLWFSPRLKEILGYADTEFQDTLGAWIRLIHPDDLKKVSDVIYAVVRSRSCFEVEYRIRHKDGEYRWACTRGEAQMDKTGDRLLVAGSFRDVTENKRTRETLAKRAREAHLLYQANAHMHMAHTLRRVFGDLARDLANVCIDAPFASSYVDFDGKVFSKNESADPVAHKVIEPIVVRGKRRGTIELRYHKAVTPESAVFNDDKQALMTLGTFIRKHVSSREIMERYQKLAKKSVVGIFIMQDEILKFVNPKFARLLQSKESEMIGKPLRAYFKCEVFLKHVLSANHGSGPRFTTQAIRKDGSVIDLEVFVQNLDYHGQPAILGTIQDITRIKKADEKIRHFNQELRQKVAEKTEDLKRANRRLQSLNELKDEFIAVTSHELRSPLTAARGYLSFIVEDKASYAQLPDILKDYVVRVYDNVEVLNNLVNNILDVSRIETGRFELYRKPVDIVDLLQSIINNFKYQLDEKKMTVTFSNRLGTPSLMLDIDSMRMRQVIRNLLDNAIKYSPVGKRIHFEIKTQGIGVQISISDEGIGIPKAQIFEVFDKFKQAKNSHSAMRGGAGLGLFIAKKIMEMHGGMIWAESQLKKGTTFRLQLPLN